ncbi:GTP cyclohydrolase II RibA [Falsiroseomonas stagni]|uniref:GTP cyclohydrolase-2 n=1 Tax=Falsiroseomonas stagni DSM 19981 TaxID=1123062 RepID=A0A1I4A983_9PROT|nr:GTP cyclohydrolase II RibA [Falsiroseomonas stagni]SFK52945.1 GTP cyclohydrolase II [Falsiroseomonas stagni DSM 19981]
MKNSAPLASQLRDHGVGPNTEPAPGDAQVAALRAVHRVASELRRGTPVLVRGPEGAILVAAAEMVSARGLSDIATAAIGPALLLLAPVRAAAVLQRPVPQALAAANAGSPPEMGVVALRLPPGLMDPAALKSLADPTAERLLPVEPERATLPPHALAAIGLAKLARLLPALVAAPATEAASLRAGLLTVDAADILSYPTGAALTLARVAEARVPLEDAPEARIVAFRAADGGIEHLAILVGQPEAALAAGTAPLARIHSECFTGDLLGSLRCDCGPQLRGAIARMAKDPAGGVLLYLAQEGRGIGLVNKLRAYALQDTGLDTLDANRALGYGADERNFWVAAEMLRAVGIPRVRLLTNNPDKLAGLAACGIGVEGREAHQFEANGVNDAYLETKARRFGHLLA